MNNKRDFERKPRKMTLTVEVLVYQDLNLVADQKKLLDFFTLGDTPERLLDIISDNPVSCELAIDEIKVKVK